MSEMMPGVAINAVEFNVGDWVTRYDSSFPGRVVGVHPGIDQVDVEYPTGWERESPEELIVLPVFHDSMGATRHNVLLLSRINQNLRSRVAMQIPTLTKQEKLYALGFAYLDSTDVRKLKIAKEISTKYTREDWNNFLSYYNRVASIVKKKKLSMKLHPFLC